jgi:hypothetical protein
LAFLAVQSPYSDDQNQPKVPHPHAKSTQFTGCILLPARPLFASIGKPILFVTAKNLDLQARF